MATISIQTHFFETLQSLIVTTEEFSFCSYIAFFISIHFSHVSLHAIYCSRIILLSVKCNAFHVYMVRWRLYSWWTWRISIMCFTYSSVSPVFHWLCCHEHLPGVICCSFVVSLPQYELYIFHITSALSRKGIFDFSVFAFLNCVKGITTALYLRPWYLMKGSSFKWYSKKVWYFKPAIYGLFNWLPKRQPFEILHYWFPVNFEL